MGPNYGHEAMHAFCLKESDKMDKNEEKLFRTRFETKFQELGLYFSSNNFREIIYKQKEKQIIPLQRHFLKAIVNVVN